METNVAFDEKMAQEELEKGYEKAKTLLNDEDKIERFMQRLEKKLKVIPVAGEVLSQIPVLASLIRSYVKKEYREIPLGSIIAIISALSYVLSPIDIIPDAIPVLGLIDDAAIITACLLLVKSDVEEYMQWREENQKVLDV